MLSTVFNLNFNKRIFRKLFFIVVILSIGGCQSDELLIDQNTSEINFQEELQGFISFETLLNNIGESRAFRNNLKHIDRNNEGIQSKGESGFLDAYIDTSTIQDYRQALEDFLKNEYDWSSESQLLKNTLIQNFGTNWKQILSGLISWKGLTKTQEFENWCNANGYTITLDQNGIPSTSALNTIVGSFNFIGNKNCN